MSDIHLSNCNSIYFCKHEGLVTRYFYFDDMYLLQAMYCSAGCHIQIREIIVQVYVLATDKRNVE